MAEAIIVRTGRAGSINLYRVCELHEEIDLAAADVPGGPVKVFIPFTQPVPYGTAIDHVRQRRKKEA